MRKVILHTERLHIARHMDEWDNEFSLIIVEGMWIGENCAGDCGVEFAVDDKAYCQYYDSRPDSIASQENRRTKLFCTDCVDIVTLADLMQVYKKTKKTADFGYTG